MRPLKFSQTTLGHVIGNGNQVDDIVKERTTRSWNESIQDREYEPDGSSTPRISAYSTWVGDVSPRFDFSLLRKSEWDEGCERPFYQYDSMPRGFGRCVTTYMHDAPEGELLPSFQGDPLLMPLRGDIDNITNTYWSALDETTRVALAVQTIPRHGLAEIRIINRFKEVG